MFVAVSLCPQTHRHRWVWARRTWLSAQPGLHQYTGGLHLSVPGWVPQSWHRVHRWDNLNLKTKTWKNYFASWHRGMVVVVARVTLITCRNVNISSDSISLRHRWVQVQVLPASLCQCPRFLLLSVWTRFPAGGKQPILHWWVTPSASKINVLIRLQLKISFKFK